MYWPYLLEEYLPLICILRPVSHSLIGKIYGHNKRSCFDICKMMNSNKYDTFYHWHWYSWQRWHSSGRLEMPSPSGIVRLYYKNLIMDHSGYHVYSFLIKNPSVDSKKSSHYKDSIVSPYPTCHILIVAVKSRSPVCPIPPLFLHNFYILLKINLFSSWIYIKYLPLDDRQPTTISYFPIHWIWDHFLFNLYSLRKWYNSFGKIINIQFSTYTMQNFRI
jgi:hypothetical protein